MEQLDIKARRDPSGEPQTRVEAEKLADLERGLWAEFAEASSVDGFCRSWLALQCRMIAGVSAGVVLLGPPDRGPYAPAAVWPHVRRSLAHLSSVAERALRDRQGLVLPIDASAPEQSDRRSRHEVAYPLQIGGRLHGVIVLELAPRQEDELQTALRQLHWGAGWLEVLFRREEALKDAADKSRMEAVLDLAGTAVSHGRFRGAATAFATELATRLACDRVSVGLIRHGHVRVVAMSHSAQFDKRTNLVRAIEAAMDEALDQQETVVYPLRPDGGTQVTRAHAELAHNYGSGAVATVPFVEDQQAVGALTLERPEDRPFDAETLELCEGVAALAGPVLEVKHRDDRWLGAKVVAGLRRAVGSLVGPRHVGLKLATSAVLGLIAFLAYYVSPFHVTAETVTEGLVQRAAAAPFEGYIATAPVKAGDVVTAGQVLATLEDRELKLERARWVSELEQARNQHSQALAERDAAEVEIASAQMAQARAQLALVEDRLSRTEIRAPFDGIVVTGDLTQSLGAPVEKGEVLFEVAPLDAYRVILQVDERDIAYVGMGQQGNLLLAAMPDEPVPFEITKVTPVSTAEEGRNYFRVEARLLTLPPRLRPGMEGVGKIEIEPRLLVWILTRRAIEWAQLELWRWTP